jgi:hypothetical protein
MRTCKFLVYNRKELKHIEKEGRFHDWGYEAPDCEGDGHYSIGICEDSDGNVYKVDPSEITFTSTKGVKNNIVNPIAAGVVILTSCDPELFLRVREKMNTTNIDIIINDGKLVPDNLKKDLAELGWKEVVLETGVIWRHSLT